MIVRACDFVVVLLRDEKDLVRGFSSRAMRRVRVTTRPYVTLPSHSISVEHRDLQVPNVALVLSNHRMASTASSDTSIRKGNWHPQPRTFRVSVRSVKKRRKETLLLNQVGREISRKL